MSQITASRIYSKLTPSEQSEMRKNIGISPEQGLSTWGSQTVGEYSSSLDLTLGGESVAYSEGQDKIFVIPTTGTTIYIGSSDESGGVTFTTGTLNASLSINSKIVAGGDSAIVYNGTETVQVSTDGGASWSTATMPDAAADIQRISYGNGIFVAVGDAMDYYTSTDGTSWADEGDFGTGGYNTINLLKYSENLSLWVMSTLNSGSGGLATYTRADPTAGGSWSVLTSGTNDSRQFGVGYDCADGFFLASLVNTSTYVYDGTTLNDDNQLVSRQVSVAGDLGSSVSACSDDITLIVTPSSEAFYSKTSGNHTLSKCQSPATDGVSIVGACYAGGTFEQFIAVDDYGILYYTLRG